MAQKSAVAGFVKTELEVLRYWEKHSIYRQAKEKNLGKKQYYFLDGPPYTSGKVHIGTAWNKSLKDMVLRYRRMQGYDVFDRPGYDMHGLPTEHATQKKLGLKTKEEIEKYGVAAFITACKKLCIENMELMNKDFARLGVWMDFDNAYQSITDEFIEGVWWLVKRAHEEGRLYEGLRTMTWCMESESSLAKHELEYRTVQDTSIFVKFKIKGKENNYLVVWTTTPWTIPYNLAIMVHPSITYAEVSVGNERWFVAKQLTEPLLKDLLGKKFTVRHELSGKDMQGWSYEHPLTFLRPIYAGIKRKAPKTHTVVLSEEYVDANGGSGLVHCAPGCGPEDYEVGHRNGLPPFNNVNSKGVVPEEMGKLAGLRARKDDKAFIKAIDDAGALIASTDIKHEYPHDWRHHQPVIFRTTKQWFFKVEDLKAHMVKENKKIRWVPDAAFNAFDSWLRNLRDNSITKQRYWGVPLPVWRCDTCEHYEVVGSIKELAARVGKRGLPKELHKPHIDDVSWACACRGEMRRIPDILDVWVDAGSVSWNALGYPGKQELCKKLFPADFILEGKDQIRGWFNLLYVASMIAFGRPSFRSAYMHGFINDSQGRKMSKSVGNYILPEEVIEKYGASTLRYYMIGAASPGLDMNYNFDDVQLKHRNLLVFWNLRSLILELRKTDVRLVAKPHLKDEERYILSRLQATIKAVTERMEANLINEVPALVESLLLDLSRNYVQLIRDKISIGTQEEREAVLYATAHTYMEGMKLFAVVAPLYAEQVYLELKDALNLSEESIHLFPWPKHNPRLIDPGLEERFALLGSALAASLAARDVAKLGLRWPSPELFLDFPGKVQALKAVAELLKLQANVKAVRYGKPPGITLRVKPNARPLGKAFGKETGNLIGLITAAEARLAKDIVAGKPLKVGKHKLSPEHLVIEHLMPEGWHHASVPEGAAYLSTKLTPQLEAEGFAREIIRRVQQLRKEAGLHKQDRIRLSVSGLGKTLAQFSKEMRSRTGAVALSLDGTGDKHPHTSCFTLKGIEFSIGFTPIE